MPYITLKPDLVFLIFLPPLLYATAWNISWNELWKWKRPIILLAFGLVIFTSATVALISNAIIPDFTLALGFLLGGIISPLDGVGPDQLNIESLINRVQKEKTEEIIFALNPNIQGDTTIYYIQKKLQHTNIQITTIARGIAFGGELEYADEMTLARSLQNRLPVDKYVSNK